MKTTCPIYICLRNSEKTKCVTLIRRVITVQFAYLCPEEQAQPTRLINSSPCTNLTTQSDNYRCMWYISLLGGVHLLYDVTGLQYGYSSQVNDLSPGTIYGEHISQCGLFPIIIVHLWCYMKCNVNIRKCTLGTCCKTVNAISYVYVSISLCYCWKSFYIRLYLKAAKYVWTNAVVRYIDNSIL